MKKIKDQNLYLILSEECGRGKPAIELAKLAISGGIDMLQMREKNKSRNELVGLGAKLCKMCKEKKVKFIVNDDPSIAKEVNADGIHLGQEDLTAWPVKKTRQLLGDDSIIGISTHSPEQFKKANEKDVDYIAFGPIFPTKTKDYFIGTDDVGKVLKITEKPVFFIGGINLTNLDELLSLGIRNIALIRAILEENDIKESATNFKKRLLRPFGARNDGKGKVVYETQDKR